MLSPDDSPSTLGLLLIRHKAGAPPVVNEIIVHCQERFERFAHAMLRRPGKPRDIETGDLVNELVARLIQRLREKTFEDSAGFLSYAARIINNYLLDLARKRKPQLVPDPGSDSSDPNLLRDIPDTTNDPEKLADWGEIHSIIAGLSEDERELFDLLFYQDLKVGEVSTLLEIPETTLRVRWQQARLHLMRLYGNELPF